MTNFMTVGRASILRRLRRSRVLGWMACALLILQVVLAADHLGASAARAAGIPQADAIGLLSLCHGESDTTVEADAVPSGSDDRGSAVLPCILCTVAHLGATGVAPSAPVVAIVVEGGRPTEIVVDTASAKPVRSPLRYGTERGPPSPSVI